MAKNQNPLKTLITREGILFPYLSLFELNRSPYRRDDRHGLYYKPYSLLNIGHLDQSLGSNTKTLPNT